MNVFLCYLHIYFLSQEKKLNLPETKKDKLGPSGLETLEITDRVHGETKLGAKYCLYLQNEGSDA